MARVLVGVQPLSRWGYALTLDVRTAAALGPGYHEHPSSYDALTEPCDRESPRTVTAAPRSSSQAAAVARAKNASTMVMVSVEPTPGGAQDRTARKIRLTRVPRSSS